MKSVEKGDFEIVWHTPPMVVTPVLGQVEARNSMLASHVDGRDTGALSICFFLRHISKEPGRKWSNQVMDQ